jgi:hypothetical protein
VPTGLTKYTSLIQIIFLKSLLDSGLALSQNLTVLLFMP